MSGILKTILSAVGNTPLVELQRMTNATMGSVLVKVEGLNVGGSIKTRTALNMIEAAEAAGQLRSGSVVTEVLFKTLNDTEINDYLDIGESFDKAGGYAIQKGAAFMVRQINGSYTNVVGLPLCEVVELLEELEITYPFSDAFFEE